MKLKKYIIILFFSFCVFAIVLCLYQNLLSKKSIPDNQAVEGQSMEEIADGLHNKVEQSVEIPDIEIEDESAQVQVTDAGDIQDAFYYTELTDDIKQRITGKSYPDMEGTDTSLQISYDDLAYVHVLYYNFEGQSQEGELICNKAIAQDLTEIFSELYDNCYPIEKICLVDEYNADDELSMSDNNTSCFNYRTVPGRTKLSNHSYGLAIDINPLYNPYVRNRDGKTLISPDNAIEYADRDTDFPYKIDKEDLCYKIFIKHGFTWGGSWNNSKDYQHFEKTE